MVNTMGFVVLLFYFLLFAAGIALIVYFFNRLNKMISLLEEIKERNKKKQE